MGPAKKEEKKKEKKKKGKKRKKRKQRKQKEEECKVIKEKWSKSKTKNRAGKYFSPAKNIPQPQRTSTPLDFPCGLELY